MEDQLIPQAMRRNRHDRRGWVSALLSTVFVCAVTVPFSPRAAASTPVAPVAAHCGGTWSAQYWSSSSGYLKLNPTTQQQAYMAYKNVGTCTWTQQYAFLGTWNPEPGQDQASQVGGNGTMGGPNTGWSNYNRIGMFGASVSPGAIADFYLNVLGPSTPGRYRLHLRPVIDGHAWMEDYGAWFEVQNQMTNSRYMNQVDPVASYNLGCRLGTMDRFAPGTQDNLVILDYGAPSWNGSTYGSLLIASGTFVSIAQITTAVEEFGHGYYVCVRNSGSGDTSSSVRVAVGTSNNSGYTTNAHGQAWATMVNDIANYWVTQGFSPQLSAAGASDLELNFGGKDAARNWVTGYDAVNNYLLYNYGDAAGCPESGTTSTPALCNNGWTQEDVYWVSYGASPSYPFPEIYNRAGAQAKQWQQLKLYANLRWGTSFVIAGVLTQYEACLTNGPCWLQSCGTGLGCYTDNKPQDGYSQMLTYMNADSRTQQASIQWLSDITWNSTPASYP